MGYYTRPNTYGGVIQCFEPDNDEKTLYIEAQYSGISLMDLIQKISDHFGPESISLLQAQDFTIEVENIHTDCLYYDLYDSNDYTDYIKITKA